jgi:thiosulfate/3-mercaptopyruvate sulfurtransferase
MKHTSLVAAADLHQNLHKPYWVLIDCRFALADAGVGHRAYRRGHIPGARYADLNCDLSAPVAVYTGRHPLPDFRVLSAKLGAWGIGNRSQVVLYDDAGGAFAGRLWWLLRFIGHQSVAVLDGGITHWLKQGLPVTTTLPTIKANSFRPYLDTGDCLTAVGVQNALARKTIRLIDARAAERYAGESEPIDRVAGHIPGAVNRPIQNNLAANGLFLPETELFGQFNVLMGKFSPEQVVHYCGSGVTACHNLLAMEHAGLKGSKLYAGSWSEWIRDKNRTVACGA